MTTLPPSISDLDQVSNQALTPLLQETQYKEVGFGLHSFMLALGATVLASSDGTTASASDNISGTSSIVPGMSGTDPHTWILYQVDTTGLYGIGPTYILLDFSEFPTPYTTPQFADCYRSEAPFVGFTDPINPPTTNPVYQMSTRASIVPWFTGLSGTFSYQYSATAHIGWFWVKENGASDVGFHMIVDAPEVTDPLKDNGPPLWVQFWHFGLNASLPSFSVGMLPGASGLNPGLPGSWITDGWDFGDGSLMADAKGRDSKIYMLVDNATQSLARMNGQTRLFYTTMQSAPFNGRTPADPDPFTLWVVGEVMVYWKQSDGDIV